MGLLLTEPRAKAGIEMQWGAAAGVVGPQVWGNELSEEGQLSCLLPKAPPNMGQGPAGGSRLTSRPCAPAWTP